MVRVIEKNSIIIGRDPVVVLSLKKWEKMKELLEHMEEAVRFNKAFEESRGEKFVQFFIIFGKNRMDIEEIAKESRL